MVLKAMRFPPQFLDEIRARVPVSEVVGRRVKLKKQGREWRGLSPFNKEKTPSFYVNDQKGFYHCFSSGKHGDQFSFLIETEGLTFPEAVERLASEAGLPMPVMTEAEVERAEKARSLTDVMELACKFYERSLQERDGAKARAYLAGRELAPQTQLKFRLGYAPGGRFALKEFLGGQGVSVPDMIEAGLLIAGPDISVPYDRFRDRVMFPIHDMRGRIVAFGGRAMEKDVPAKYLNSPETSLFHKGSLLYNGHSAREHAHKANRVIAVEGYIDVIAMATAGFGETVAPLGTALTADQLEIMWKLAPEPLLLFDGDKAGRKAAYRAIDIALPLLKPGRSLVFASLPEGQDPDDLIRAQGREGMEQVLKGALPLASLLWLRETEGGVFETPDKRAALEKRLGDILQTMADETLRRHYRDDLFGRLADTFGRPARRSGQGNGGGRNATSREAFPQQRPSPVLSNSHLVRGPHAAIPRREAQILAIVINHPWLLDQHAETLSMLDFRNAEGARLKDAILDIYAFDQAQDREQLISALLAKDDAERLGQSAAQVLKSALWNMDESAAPDDVKVTWTQLLALQQRMQALHRELKDAERALSEDFSDTNFAWLQDVKRRQEELSGTEALIEGFGAASGRGKA